MHDNVENASVVKMLKQSNTETSVDFEPTTEVSHN